VNLRGTVTAPNSGPASNNNERIWCEKRSACELTYDFFYSLFCLPCAIGFLVESSGAPCWFGSCCVSAIQAQNSQRYVRRLRPVCCNELVEDCLIPGSIVVGGSFIPFVGAYSIFLLVPFVWRNLAEENAIKNRSICYGLDLIGACAYGCSYLGSGCTCKAVEGRYLFSEA
jgi:hypothetical protein